MSLVPHVLCQSKVSYQYFSSLLSRSQHQTINLFILQSTGSSQLTRVLIARIQFKTMQKILLLIKSVRSVHLDAIFVSPNVQCLLLEKHPHSAVFGDAIYSSNTRDECKKTTFPCQTTHALSIAAHSELGR